MVDVKQFPDPRWAAGPRVSAASLTPGQRFRTIDGTEWEHVRAHDAHRGVEVIRDFHGELSAIGHCAEVLLLPPGAWGWRPALRG